MEADGQCFQFLGFSSARSNEQSFFFPSSTSGFGNNIKIGSDQGISLAF